MEVSKHEPDPPFSDNEEQYLDEVKLKSSGRMVPKSITRGLQLSEVELKLHDSIGSIKTSSSSGALDSSSSGRVSSAGYRRKVLQNVISYLNPLGYFKNTPSEPERWEIPFEDIMELSFIGSGGQGTVFSGLYRDKEIAIKKVNDPKQTDIKHLRKLVHPNIITFLGVCTKPPCYCVIMDYCRLGNLYQYIRKFDIDILPRKVIQWARDISNGMQFLHSKRIIHRDLKSLNVLVNEDESLKISDFGTSRVFENQTTKMTVIGSSSWMAPELIRNESCNEKVDVWSFGVCLWELITREEPYKDLNHSAILYGVGTNKLSLPIPNGCPQDMKLLLESCWQQKPKLRPSFRQILDHLNVIFWGDFLDYTPTQYKTTQETWKVEIASIMEELIKSLQMPNLADEDSSLIISKREEELRHAKEVREMYEKKLATATELCEQLASCQDMLTKKEEQLEKLAKKLYKEEWLQSSKTGGSNGSSTSSEHKHKRRRIKSGRKKSDSKSNTLPTETKPRSLSAASTCSSVSSSGSFKPELLITSHGDYSPAVRDFLQSISITSHKVTAPFTRRHIRTHSYSGKISLETTYASNPDETTSTAPPEIIGFSNYKQKSFDDELTEVPSSSPSNTSRTPVSLSSLSDNEQQ